MSTGARGILEVSLCPIEIDAAMKVSHSFRNGVFFNLSGYTLRRSPAPAHPDNRLLQALRLLHSDDISTNTIHRYLDNPSQPDAPIRLFLQVLSGEREILSEKSEQQARKRLEDYCAELLQDCGEAEKSLDMMRAAESEGFMGVEDWRTAVGTIERLWNSQREIAQAVKNSLEDGVEL